MSQSLCNSLFLHFYIFLQCEDVLNIVSYIVPPYGAKALQVVGVDGMKRQTNTGISPLTGRKPCKASLEKPHKYWLVRAVCGAEANSALVSLKIFS